MLCLWCMFLRTHVYVCCFSFVYFFCIFWNVCLCQYQQTSWWMKTIRWWFSYYSAAVWLCSCQQTDRVRNPGNCRKSEDGSSPTQLVTSCTTANWLSWGLYTLPHFSHTCYSVNHVYHLRSSFTFWTLHQAASLEIILCKTSQLPAKIKFSEAQHQTQVDQATDGKIFQRVCVLFNE